MRIDACTIHLFMSIYIPIEPVYVHLRKEELIASQGMVTFLGIHATDYIYNLSGGRQRKILRFPPSEEA